MSADQPAAVEKINPGRWAIICGQVARVHGQRRGDNPHPKGSPAARLWAFGHGLTRFMGRNVARETSRPGRGHARIGTRSEWSEADLALLRFCSGGVSPVAARDLEALLPGRSEPAIRAQRCRLGQETRSRPDAFHPAPPGAGQRPGDPLSPHDGGSEL